MSIVAFMEVKADKPNNLKRAFHIGFSSWNDETKKATHYDITDEDGLTFYDGVIGNNADALPLPFPMSTELAIEMALEWLEKVDYSKYCKQHDTDGSNTKGFYIRGSGYGHLYTILSIKPEYIVYSK